jgi:hypothetical protein
VYAGWEATFDASGSSGDGLSFSIDFGDGTVAKTAVTPHVVLAPGAIRATVTDRFGRIDSQTLTLQLLGILNSGGDAFFSVQNPLRRLYFYHQNGSQLTGYYQPNLPQSPTTPGPTSPLTATLSGANHMHIRLDDGSMDMDGTYTQQLLVNGYVVTGLILSMRGGSADGTVDSFFYHDPY